MTTYITLNGLGDALLSQSPENCTQVLELKEGQSMLPQLLKVEDPTDVMVSVPDNWPEEEKNRFVLKVHEYLTSIMVSRNTVGAFSAEWMRNALTNYERARNSIPADQVGHQGEYALIVGAGPSVNGFDIPKEAQSFVAWSAVNKLGSGKINVLGHCDHRRVDARNDADWLAYTPTCHPSFLKGRSSWNMYIYYNKACPIATWFADKRNYEEHEPIAGHVVDMLMQMAIYSGHDTVKLIGVDLCCRSVEDLLSYHPGVVPLEAVNYNGDIVYTDDIFLTYQRGLEELVRRWPEKKFRNLSPDGIILEGVPYESY